MRSESGSTSAMRLRQAATDTGTLGSFTLARRSFKLLVPLDTEDENADILTKARRGDGKFAKFRNNLVNIPKG